MPFDYEANVTAVRTALRDHNTTTASPFLSADLSTTVQTIEIDDPEIIGVRWNDLPAVYVRVSDADEEGAAIGETGPTKTRKFKNASYEIIGLYHKEGARTQHKDVLTQIYRLAENIEGVFQAEFRLSNTALWAHPERTDFGAVVGSDGTRVKGVMVTLRARYLFR